MYNFFIAQKFEILYLRRAAELIRGDPASFVAMLYGFEHYYYYY